MKALQEFQLDDNLIPESNNFYQTESGGTIGVYVEPTDPVEYSLTLESGTVYTSDFTLGDPYKSFVVKDKATIVVDRYRSLEKHYSVRMKLCKNSEIHGELQLPSCGILELGDGVELILHPDSYTRLEYGSQVILGEGSNMMIYGKMDICSENDENGIQDLSMANFIFDSENITIDAIAVVDVKGISVGKREYSMSEYEHDLSLEQLAPYTQSTSSISSPKMVYSWIDGSVSSNSQVIDMGVLWSEKGAEAILGDFKFECLGSQVEMVPNIQVVRNMRIYKRGSLYVSSLHNGHTYFRPELYFGVILENIDTPADCLVEGELVLNTPDAKLTFDRGGTLHIAEGGVVDLSNGATLRCTSVEEKPKYSDDPTIIFIDGTLKVDRIEQLEIPYYENIVFGENGKLVIRNIYEGEKVLFETPDGLLNSELYRIFTTERDGVRDYSKLEHVEYHVPDNCGLKIDHLYSFYSTEMTQWYAGRRLEQALKEGLILWHSGFILLDQSVIPWVSENTTLYDLAKMFKYSTSNDRDRLQEVVDHMVYCGVDGIRFILSLPDHRKMLWLRTQNASVKTVAYDAEHSTYNIEIDSDKACLFLKNKMYSSDSKTIMNKSSISIPLEESTDFIV